MSYYWLLEWVVNGILQAQYFTERDGVYVVVADPYKAKRFAFQEDAKEWLGNKYVWVQGSRLEFKVVEHGFVEEEKEEEKEKVDMVNHPSHYKQGKYEVIDVLDDWQLEPYEWQVVKYIARAKHKGNQLQDLKKAQWYLNRKIEQMEKKNKEK